MNMLTLGVFNMKMAIYGAQGYAPGIHEAVKTMHPDGKMIGFLVTEIGGWGLIK